jgi:hypothetical protein
VDNKILIKTLLAGGIDQVEIAELLEQTNNNSHLEEALAYLHEAAGQSRQVKLSYQIGDWVDQQEGWFTLQQLSKDFPGLNPSTRDSQIRRFRIDGIIEADKNTAGKYRRVDNDNDVIDWMSADVNTALDLKFPFGLEDYCYLFPGNVVVIAGTGNAGKTAFMLDTARLNMEKYPVVYFSSEMGDVELKHRLLQFENHGIISLPDWRVEFRERSANFADVVRPGYINFIDYLELTDKFYNVGELIIDIWKKLAGSGLAIISIQKDPKSSMGRGGQFSMEKSRLYLNMDYNKLTIVKAKIRKNPTINPNGMAFTFTDITGGCIFENIQRWDGSV